MKNKTVYLDNAATTFPKPSAVTDAVYECIKNYCGNPSRGSNPLAMLCAQKVFECRETLSNMFACPTENVIFTYNTTYALNMAIKGIMQDGGHILISDLEHNAVLRPVASLQRDGWVEYDTFEAYAQTPEQIISDIDRKKRPDTRAVCCTHISNICSYTLPIKEIGKYCRDNNLIFICDGAQSAGHIPINMQDCNIDILCIPFHKGLYGPQGGGAMLLSEGVSPPTIIQGGNGVNSLEYFMGDTHPEKYEAGTLNTPAIIGLCEGLKFVNTQSISEIQKHDKELFSYTLSALSNIRGVKIYDHTPGSTLLFNVEGFSSDEVGEILGCDGICVRTGFHCSPLSHKALRTPSHGAVRVSFGSFNTISHIDFLCSAAERMCLRKRRI